MRAVLCAWSLFLLAVAVADDGVLMRYRSAKGDVYRYAVRLRIDFDMSRVKDLPKEPRPGDEPGYAEIWATVQEKVVDIKSGGFLSTITASGLGSKFEGMFLEAKEEFEKEFSIPSETVYLNNLGQSLKGEPQGSELTGQMAMHFPKGRVRPGDSWRVGNTGAEVVYWGTAVSHGKPAYELSGDWNLRTPDKLSFSVPTRSLVEQSTGRLLSSRGQIRIAAPNGVAMRMTLTMDRL